MKHLLGGGFVVWDEVDVDSVTEVVVWASTVNVVCAWALLYPGLLAETNTVYVPALELGGKIRESA